jgi:WD40 repeat protein
MGKEEIEIDEKLNEKIQILRSVIEFDDKIIVGNKSGTFFIYTKKLKLKKTINAHDLQISTIARINNDYFATGSADKKIKIWSKKGELIKTLKGHSNTVRRIILLENNLFLSLSIDGFVFIWNQNFEKVEKFQTEGYVSVIQLKNGKLCMGCKDNGIKIYNKNGDLKKEFKKEHNDQIISLLELDNSNIVSSSKDHTIRIWSKKGDCLKVLHGHVHLVREIIKFGKDRIISTSDDKTLKLWSTKSGECKETLYGHTPIYELFPLSDNYRFFFILITKDLLVLVRLLLFSNQNI